MSQSLELLHRSDEPSVPTLDIGPAGAWFQVVGHDRVDVGSRPVLARLVNALAAPGEDHHAIDALCASTWPGERAEPRSMRRRLHFAVSELRRLGLRGILVSHGGGYRLDALVRRPKPRRHPLRTPTDAFVGRQAEIHATDAAVDGGARIIGVLGVAGVGKSRLALEVAHRAAARGIDVAWADLGGVTGRDGFRAEVARAVGADESDEARLVAALVRERPLLLVLDDADHDIAVAAACVAAWSGGAPNVRFLATSRVPLEIAGETRVRLAPLGPADALRLLEVRSAELAAPVTGDPTRLLAVLDGLPLAIELAAARLDGLTTDRLADWITDDRDGALSRARRDAPAHHQSLHRLLDRSWQNASAAAREGWARLSVLCSAFGEPEAAALLGRPPGAVIACLHDLVTQHLLTTHRFGDELRYRMLDTLRDFGRARLVERGWADETAHRHLAHFSNLPVNGRFGRWMADLWVAFGVARGARDVEAAVRCLSRMPPRGDVLAACDALLASDDIATASAEARCTLEALRGASLVNQRDPRGVVELQALVCRPDAAIPDWLRGSIHLCLGAVSTEVSAQRHHFQRAADAFRASDHPEDEAHAQGNLAALAAATDPHEAVARLERVIACLGGVAPPLVSYNLGIIHHELGAFDAALRVHTEALTAADDPIAEGVALRGLAAVLADLDRPDDAIAAGARAERLHLTAAPHTRGITLITFAWVLRAANRLLEAEDHAVRAVELLLANESLACGRAEAYLAVIRADLGRPGAAKFVDTPVTGIHDDLWCRAYVAWRIGRLEMARTWLAEAEAQVVSMRLPPHAPLAARVASLRRQLGSG